MAEFNLGRIKGEKGDTGPKGEKGDTGAKGEKGDKGDNGRDGYTPVFSVAGVTTLENGENALVEIDTSNPVNPSLTFRIPKGKDGKDALGDMLKAVYDPDGVEEDVFAYARNLFEGCLKNEGGHLSGTLTATESPLTERAVRNISVGSVLPDAGAEGDIFVLMRSKNSKTLADCEEGGKVILKEKGEDTEYLVVGKGYHGENTVTLVRNMLHPTRCCYDYAKRGSYSMSDVDVFLETIFIMDFPEDIKRKLVSVETETENFRHCFLLSKNDYTVMNYFSAKTNRVTSPGLNSEYARYITSTIGEQKNIVTVTQAGDFGTASMQSAEYLRPAIVLPGDFPVINIQYENSYAVKLPETKEGIYVRADGMWKECALI